MKRNRRKNNSNNQTINPPKTKSLELKIKDLKRIDKDGIYIIQFTRNPTHEEAQFYHETCQKVFEACGARFVIFGAEMDLLEPQDIFHSPEFLLMLEKAVKAWGDKPRIIV